MVSAWPVKCRPMARPRFWGPAMPSSVQSWMLTRPFRSVCPPPSGSAWGCELWPLLWTCPAQAQVDVVGNDQRAAVMAAEQKVNETDRGRGSRPSECLLEGHGPESACSRIRGSRPSECLLLLSASTNNVCGRARSKKKRRCLVDDAGPGRRFSSRCRSKVDS